MIIPEKLCECLLASTLGCTTHHVRAAYNGTLNIGTHVPTSAGTAEGFCLIPGRLGVTIRDPRPATITKVNLGSAGTGTYRHI